MLFCSVAPQAPVNIRMRHDWLLASLRLACSQPLSCGHVFVSMLRPPPLAPPHKGPQGGGDRTDYAATVLRRSPACRVERKEERASARWSSLHERRSRSRPSYTSERTILTSDAEKPHRSYNDLAGFPDRTLRSHSSQPAARPQSNSFAINRPPMPPRRNSGTT